MSKTLKEVINNQRFIDMTETENYYNSKELPEVIQECKVVPASGQNAEKSKENFDRIN